MQVYPGQGPKVALLDLGVKENMIRSLQKRGCEVTVFPAHTPAKVILEGGFDGVMLSNGPGDPADNVQIIEELRQIYNSDMVVFAVCLGHQLMALATGATTEKLKYGHRGANHPVRDIDEGRVYITSQNHGYVVKAESVDPKVATISHVNVNDGTVEGLKYQNGRVFTVQFHPEAAPGPMDTGYLFDRFVAKMEAKKNA
jgi:carbamoyl-phosphate synthase small subunit